MRFSDARSTDAVLRELGRRIERRRIDLDLTQAVLAEEAGVGRATVQRLEAGRSVQLASLVGVLRALGLAGALETAVPLPPPSPIAQVQADRATRRRASRRAPGQAPPAGAWRWGDEGDGG